MEKNGNKIKGIIAAVSLLVLIFDSSLALEGARLGIELCIKTVIPSLFPFFVLSIIITNALGERISYPLKILAGILGIPKTATSVLIPAILGGYPVGAKCVGDLYQNRQLRKNEAERLLAFCSNAGPSFLFGMVSGFFPERKIIWLLWSIHLTSALLTAVIIPSEKKDTETPPSQKRSADKSAIVSAASAMSMVCCWVVLFRVIMTFLDSWFLWTLPAWAKVFLMGILELTNGCCELLLITDVRMRFVLCACMLSFGGICVLFQTMAVTNELSLKWYIKGKLMQMTFSLLLSCGAVVKQGFFIVVIIPVLMIILRKIQNRCRNPWMFPV